MRICMWRACADPKVLVRKAVVACLEAVLVHRRTQPDADDGHKAVIDREWQRMGVRHLCRACVDLGLSVRRQGAESLTHMLRVCHGQLDDARAASLRIAWLKNVLPLATDRENTVVEASATFVCDVIVKPLCAGGTETVDHAAAWYLLTAVEKNVQWRCVPAGACTLSACRSQTLSTSSFDAIN
jgi:predicted Fe-S protein YdhL (DUF1289 family)